MELSIILQMYTWNSYGSLAIGLALNFVLLFVAKNCPSSGLRGYRRVVFYFCMQNIAMLILQAINQPITFADGNNFNYIVLNGPIAGIHLPFLWTIVNVLYILFFDLIMIGLAMQFVERYLVIFRNNKNPILRNSVIGIPSLTFTAFAVTTGLLTIPERMEANPGDLNKELFAGAEDVTKNMKIAAQFDPDNSIITTIFIVAASLMSFSYLATIFCYRRIRAFLKANMQTDIVHGVKRKTLNNIIRNMLIQAFVSIFPLLLSASIMGYCLIAHFGNSLGQVYLLFFGPLNWLPVLNPLVTIFTIDKYRRGIFGIFKIQQQSVPLSKAYKHLPFSLRINTKSLRFL